MNFYKLIKNGCKIKIDDPAGVYAPSEFYAENNQIFVYNPATLICEVTKTAKEINKHISKMITEGFTITIEAI